MNNVFNSVQMFKSSEDCDKYSKSVSYETLVGGTATIGREIKQTQRLFLGSADKPLSAVGTLTSLLCNSAKVKALSFLRLRGASGEKQKESSLVQHKSERQAIFKFVLSSASGGAGGGKYNRISAFVSMPVLLIRRSLEKFFKKNFRDDSFCFGFAKVVALTLLFTIATTAESRADESATTSEDTTQTQESQKLLSDSGKCGNGCLYQITTDSTTGKQNLRVYNDPNYTGETKNINAYAFRGNGYINSNYYDNYYSNAVFDKIIIDGDFETIGSHAFTNTSANEVVFNGNIGSIGYGGFEGNNLTSVNLPEGLQKIGGEAFYGNSISSIVIPDSVTNIGNYAFVSTQGVEEVQITDTLDSLGYYDETQQKQIIHYPFGHNADISIICKGDEIKCQSLVTNYRLDDSSVETDLSGNVTGVDKDHCTGDKYFWNGTSCSRKESYCNNKMYYTGYECKMRPTDGSEIACDYDISGYVKVGNNCYSPEVTYAKKHYTPAEANQWLKDDDNFVILTFKK